LPAETAPLVGREDGQILDHGVAITKQGQADATNDAPVVLIAEQVPRWTCSVALAGLLQAVRVWSDRECEYLADGWQVKLVGQVL
jgi:hypothetical protein